jgi:hypothetical protein
MIVLIVVHLKLYVLTDIWVNRTDPEEEKKEVEGRAVRMGRWMEWRRENGEKQGKRFANENYT